MTQGHDHFSESWAGQFETDIGHIGGKRRNSPGPVRPFQKALRRPFEGLAVDVALKDEGGLSSHDGDQAQGLDAVQVFRIREPGISYQEVTVEIQAACAQGAIQVFQHLAGQFQCGFAGVAWTFGVWLSDAEIHR